LHNLSTAFVLGYHGCDREVAEKLLAGSRFEASQNDYDWLGWGIYFWESNPRRGLEFAREWQTRGKINDPYVVGAVLDLDFCLDLTTSTGVAAVKAAHADFIRFADKAGTPLPKNRGGEDMLLRELDCAVINHLHQIRSAATPPLEAFDSVKGIFLEGGRIYEDAGFFNKPHIQICIRAASCIKGVFRVPDKHLEET
jgi:hypothetical protein